MPQNVLLYICFHLAYGYHGDNACMLIGSGIARHHAWHLWASVLTRHGVRTGHGKNGAFGTVPNLQGASRTNQHSGSGQIGSVDDRCIQKV